MPASQPPQQRKSQGPVVDFFADLGPGLITGGLGPPNGSGVVFAELAANASDPALERAIA